MQQIIVMSDSHGLVHEIGMICDRHNANKVFHCGDSELKREHPMLQEITVVEGNCDITKQFNQDEIINVEGVRFLMTHGHLYNVKKNLTSLSYRASEVEADIVCFGHSHVVYAEQDEHHLYINPGSIHFPRIPTVPTYVVLTVDGKEVMWTLLTLHGEEIDMKYFTIA